MKCINCHSPLLPALSEHRHIQHREKKAKFFWFSSAKSSCRLQKGWNGFTPVSIRPKNLPSSLFIVAASLDASPDIAVLLETSAVLVFVYWIANFVVPRIIIKDLQFDETDENKSPTDKNL